MEINVYLNKYNKKNSISFSDLAYKFSFNVGDVKNTYKEYFDSIYKVVPYYSVFEIGESFYLFLEDESLLEVEVN